MTINNYHNFQISYLDKNKNNNNTKKKSYHLRISCALHELSLVYVKKSS